MNIRIDMAICRVCLKPGNDVNIFTGDILEKFVYTTLVQAKQNDGLSESMCRKCVSRMRIAYEFKKQAISSDQELRSFISGVNQKFIQVTGIKGNAPSKNAKKTWAKKEDENLTDDQLDEDMEALLNEDDDTMMYSTFEANSLIDDKQMMARNQLVEILRENSSTARLSKQQIAYIDETSQSEPQEMEVFLIDEPEDGCIVEGVESEEDYENLSESALEETEPQYLEFDAVDDNVELRSTRSLVQASIGTAKENPMNRCTQCNKSFSTRTNLTRHMITHQGVKPYVCNICQSSFTQRGSLKSHMYIHTGERPYKCDQCDRAFTQSKSLTFHMRRHTGEKPFACDYCGVKFRQKDGLKRHIAAKHPANDSAKKIYRCDLCKKKVFSSKYTLNVHQTKHCENRKLHKKKAGEDQNNAESVSDDTAIDIKNEDENGQEIEDGYGCGYCDEIFASIDEMIQHTSTHPEAKDDGD